MEDGALEQAQEDYLKFLFTNFETVGRGTKYERAEYDIEQYLKDFLTDILDPDELRLAWLDGGMDAVKELFAERLETYLDDIATTAVYEKMGLR